MRNANRIGISTRDIVTVLKAKARNMRAFSWAALGKGCIRIRQGRAESEVIQETLFGFFSAKRGIEVLRRKVGEL